MKRTKILITYGPATASLSKIARLVQAGANAFRINCSHGSSQDFLAAARIITEGAARSRYPVGLLFDIAGPKLRLDRFDGKITVTKGMRITLSHTRSDPSKGIVAMSQPGVLSSVRKGERVLIDDGNLLFDVVAVDRHGVTLRALNPGTILPGKGVNLPSTAIDVPTLSDKDREDIKTAVRLDADYIALSFVRSADDVREARAIIRKLGGRQKIFAKLEKREAIDNLDAIMEASDGVMIARGDLGVEMPPEAVPRLQKKIIALSIVYHKPVIVATQMLESMRFSPRPTRAEVNDVATAVFDRADAVMLSAETATGRYPVEAVRTMSDIITAAEFDMSSGSPFTARLDLDAPIPQAVATAVLHANERLEASAIFAFTSTGFTAQLIANLMPPQPIIAVTDDRKVMRSLSLYRGVYAVKGEHPGSFNDLTDTVNRICREHRLARRGAAVFVTGGAPFGSRVQTNLLFIHEVK
ncbi:MAG: pyruvate kinase [candidate division Zixibacteria bacterium]|jgi:pyruvate kinase|nr:pyruvate kinase [candidate division Zixibacteria bacterium]